MRSMMGWLTIGICFSASPVIADDFKLEEGYTLLFNGKDFTDWKTTKGESLDGKDEAYKGRFKAKDGMIVVDPSVKGDVRIVTTKQFAGDVDIKFDFKPDAKCNNDLFLQGMKFDLKKADVKNLKVGEWNAFEIVVKGGMAEFKNNGERIKKVKVKGKSSPFEIRAEFGAIEIRRLRARE